MQWLLNNLVWIHLKEADLKIPSLLPVLHSKHHIVFLQCVFPGDDGDRFALSAKAGGQEEVDSLLRPSLPAPEAKRAPRASPVPEPDKRPQGLGAPPASSAEKISPGPARGGPRRRPCAPPAHRSPAAARRRIRSAKAAPNPVSPQGAQHQKGRRAGRSPPATEHSRPPYCRPPEAAAGPPSLRTCAHTAFRNTPWGPPFAFNWPKRRGGPLLLAPGPGFRRPSQTRPSPSIGRGTKGLVPPLANYW